MNFDEIIKALTFTLQSFIHVSTIYANCHVKHIEERFYTYPIDHKELIAFTHTLPESVINKKLTKCVFLFDIQ